MFDFSTFIQFDDDQWKLKSLFIDDDDDEIHGHALDCILNVSRLGRHHGS